MTNRSFPRNLPNWFRMACCATPLLSLLTLTTGIAMGVSVNPVVIGGLAVLSWRVISVVTGIKPTPKVIQRPARDSSPPRIE
jgi:hypothetical protein